MRAARRRLVIASNRGPIVYGRSDGQRTARRGGGGLVTALSGLVASQDVTWVAAAISDEDDVVAPSTRAASRRPTAAGNPFQLRLVRLDRADYDRYYNVFANPLLWFIQHGLWNRPYAPEMSAATRAAWESYRARQRGLRGGAGRRVRRGRRRCSCTTTSCTSCRGCCAAAGVPAPLSPLHAHPLAGPRRLAGVDGRHAHRAARGPARRRRDRLPHQPLGARVPGDGRGVRRGGVRRPRAAPRDAPRGRHPCPRVPDLGRPGRVPRPLAREDAVAPRPRPG